MILIILVTSLIVEKYYRHIDKVRNFQWYENLLKWLYASLEKYRLYNGPAIVLLSHLLILVPLYLILLVLDDISPLLSFAAGLLILVFSLGPRNLHEQMQALLHESGSDDFEQISSRMHDVLGDTLPGDQQALYRLAIGNIFAQANERLLAVLFWFVILGPVGAALVRQACLSAAMPVESENLQDARNTFARMRYILLWLPARLTAASFALTGSFVHTLENWRHHQQWAAQWPDPNQCILVATGFGALNLSAPATDQETGGTTDELIDTHHIQAALDLTMRAVISGAVVFSLAILAGWTG